MNRKEIIKLIHDRINSPEKEKFLAEIKPEEEGTTTDYLWISGVLPCINTWYDKQLDIFFMHHSVHMDRPEPIDKYTLHEDTADDLELEIGKLNIEILSLILRTIPKRLDWKGRIFHSVAELEFILDDLGIMKEYRQKIKEHEEYLKLLENPDLVSVGFNYYKSWETGIRFWVLKKNVSPEIFKILKEQGLFYHKPDVDNEERFRGWCIRADRPILQQINFAKRGLKL